MYFPKYRPENFSLRRNSSHRGKSLPAHHPLFKSYFQEQKVLEGWKGQAGTKWDHTILGALAHPWHHV